jgi:hypothetical protein
MKKLIIALVATTAIAHADISVNLFTDYGFYNADGSRILDTGESAVIQLINSGANGTADAVTAATGAAFGDDSIIGSVTITASADPEGDFSGYAYLAGETINEVGTAGADVFARLYIDSSFSANSLYYDGGIVTAGNVDLSVTPPPTPSQYNFGGATGVSTADFATVIPEPATIGLMGIAAAGLFAARRKVRV